MVPPEAMRLVLLVAWAAWATAGAGAQGSDPETRAQAALEALARSQLVFDQVGCHDGGDMDEFDFIVVGAGAAGCPMANRLSEVSDWSVLLLEAGAEESFFMDIPYLQAALPWNNWNYTAVPQPSGGCPSGPEAECPYPRGHVMGGSTTVNLMFFTRGNKLDFDHWAALGNDGWDYDSVLPFFRRSENVQIPELRDSPYHGTHGPVMNSRPFSSVLANMSLESGAELGIPAVDYNGAQQAGISRIQSTTYQGARWSANRGYVLPLRGGRRPNLFVRPRSFVTRLIVRGGRVLGVEYERDGRKRSALARKEVVLSAGAINTPKILMLSGIGPRQHLEELGIHVRADLPVGRNLYDHAMFLGLIIQFNTSVIPTRWETLTNLDTLQDYLIDREGPFGGLRQVEAIRFFEVGEEAINASWANMEMFLFGQPSYSPLYGFDDEFMETFADPLVNMSVIMPVLINVRPKSHGTVTLRDADPHTPPAIDPAFFTVEEDVNFTVQGVRDAIRLYTTGPFAALGARVYPTPIPACAGEAFGTDAYWACAVRRASATIYHPCCTSAMGPRGGPGDPVVAPDLKVHGLRGLRVVDASAMPSIPAAHLQAAVYMMGERGAGLVKCEHLGGEHCAPPDPDEL